MTLEEAIKTAIEFEIKIRDIYREAEAAVEDEAGKRIFGALGSDEQNHIDYLQHTLAQLTDTGKIDPVQLESAIPSSAAIDQETAKIESLVAKDFYGIKKQMLSKALKAEIETSNFTKRR